MKYSASDLFRFWSKVKPEYSDSACWLWQGAKFHSGYGAFRWQGKTLRSHRVAFEMAGFTLDPEQVITHLCHNPACVNPAHLSQDTQSGNLLQAGARGSMTRSLGVNSVCHLPPEALSDIREGKLSNRAYARKYGVEHHTIARIKKALL